MQATKKQRGATGAQIAARESRLTGKAQEIARSINAQAERKAEVEKARKSIKVVAAPARCPSCSGTEKVQMHDGDMIPCARCICTECGAALPEPWAPCAKCGAGAQS